MIPTTPTSSTVSTATGEAPHWPALDGLRGLAVIGVVAFHVDRLPGGFLGVDLFFTLSGFLITTLLVREHVTTGALRLGRFWARRFRRLLPAVMLLIGAVLAWLAVWGTPAEQATSRDDAAWAIPYLANWHLIDIARDYWASATSASAFTHLWSLAIEEQFYVLWPLVVWALARRPRTLVAATLAAILASGTAMVVLASTHGDTRAYMGTDTRAAALLLGALVALPAIRGRIERAVVRHPGGADVVLVTAAVTLAALWWAGGRDLDVLLRGGLLLHSLAAAIVVAILVEPAGGSADAAVAAAPRSQLRSRVSRWLADRRLTWVGTMSYGIYLWHWPLIQLGRPRLDGLPAGVRDAVLVAGSVGLAVVSYHLVEQPVRRQRSWARGRRAAAATVALTAAAVTVVVVAPSGRGSVATFDPDSVAETTSPVTTGPSATSVPPVMSDPPGRRPSPTSSAPSATGSSTTPTSGPATTVLRRSSRAVDAVLWIGDSVAADAAPALDAAFGAAGIELIDGAFAGRRITPSDTVDPLTLYPPLLAAGSPDLVVVQLSIWDDDENVDVQRIALGWFRDLVLGTGADLVLVPHPPTPDDAAKPGSRTQVDVAAELAAEGPDRVHLLDPTALWGDGVDLDLDDDRVPDRKPDGVHLCPQGAARYAAWLSGALADRYAAIVPADPATWLGGTWAADPTYDTPVGACALLSD